jgi:hypothetical protein
MTQLPPPVPFAQVSRPVLRPVEHPDLSAVLTHFCDRTRPQDGIPAGIRDMAAPQRLESILWESRLRAFVTYSGGDPAVCLTEATLSGLNFLIGRRSYQPWGLVFDRQSVYDADGGPVWYARPDEYYSLKDLYRSGKISSRIQSWLVRLEPGSSDWLEEREWRIPLSAAAAAEPALPLQALRLVALLVGDPNWSPTRVGWGVSPVTGAPFHGPIVPSLLAGVPRWWWNPTEGKLNQLPALA